MKPYLVLGLIFPFLACAGPQVYAPKSVSNYIACMDRTGTEFQDCKVIGGDPSLCPQELAFSIAECGDLYKIEKSLDNIK